MWSDGWKQSPIEGMVKVVEEQTNTAMQAVGVDTKVIFVRIVYLSPEYDGRPSGTTLQDIRNSKSIDTGEQKPERIW